MLGRAIDDLTRGVTRGKLAGYGALLLAIGLVGGLFQFLSRRILIGASRDIEYDMRNDFFAHLETLPLGYFQAHRTGDLMSRATNDLNAVRMMIGPSIMYSANTLLTFVVALVGDDLDRPAAGAVVAHPAAVRLDLGEAVRHGDPQAVRADSGAAVGGERGRAGSALGRPRRPRLPAGGRGARTVPACRSTSTCAAIGG